MNFDCPGGFSAWLFDQAVGASVGIKGPLAKIPYESNTYQ